jgi:hypothetical protein
MNMLLHIQKFLIYNKSPTMFVYISKAYIHQKYLHTELNLNKVSKYIWIQMKYKTENQNRKRKTERLTRPGHFNPAPAQEPDQLAQATAQPNFPLSCYFHAREGIVFNLTTLQVARWQHLLCRPCQDVHYRLLAPINLNAPPLETLTLYFPISLLLLECSW